MVADCGPQIGARAMAHGTCVGESNQLHARAQDFHHFLRVDMNRESLPAQVELKYMIKFGLRAARSTILSGQADETDLLERHRSPRGRAC